MLKVRAQFSDGLSHFSNHAWTDRREKHIRTAPYRRDPWSGRRAVALNETRPTTNAQALVCD
jgi:hypothetical protein